ncbi:hypothetical protein GEMRC1_004278 [Eukaryota sp. GEM-RC1]
MPSITSSLQRSSSPLSITPLQKSPQEVKSFASPDRSPTSSKPKSQHSLRDHDSFLQIRSKSSPSIGQLFLSSDKRNNFFKSSSVADVSSFSSSFCEELQLK